MKKSAVLDINDQRLIEHGFPCHQVGAETQRERGASSALPPLYFLHVWWARRPLTPSRAAIAASLDSVDTDPEVFVRRLGIERVQALVRDEPWTLAGELLNQVQIDASGAEALQVDERVLRRLREEDERRAENRSLIAELKAKDASLAGDPVLMRWGIESQPLPQPWPKVGEYLPVQRVMGDPAHVQARIAFAQSKAVQAAIGREIKWAPEDLYGYNRAFINSPDSTPTGRVVLDPTSGGGSIPFEALRLGHTVLANELNPVATVILYATLDYPARFGVELADDIERWGRKLLDYVERQMEGLAPFSPLPEEERTHLRYRLRNCPEIFPQFDVPEFDHTGLLYARQVTCSHCGGEAPLLNTCWLSKEAGEQWGVRIITDGQARGGKVVFQTYRVVKGSGPHGEDPNQATVNRGIGQCVHCQQAISGEEIKAQARGESPHGRWTDRLYCVVAVRLEPKLDKHGKPQRYASGARKGEIKTHKVRFFRPPKARDLQALKDAEARLQERWPAWEAAGVIPTERFPEGNDTRPIQYGMPRWCDLFTPRQLLGHLTLAEGLNRLKAEILHELGPERGRAVVTYLQFTIDKGLDYNSRQTRWHYGRGVLIGTFGRHDFSLKWTFGEMTFTGPNSGSAWGLAQVVEAYRGIAALVEPLYRRRQGVSRDCHATSASGIAVAAHTPPVTILNGSAAHMPGIPSKSVDLVCMDPPYYDNVQYGELSNYFYVWQKRTLADLYPALFSRRLVNKTDEAVANPARDGSTAAAKVKYEQLLKEIFAECRRVLKDNGLMTLMFTHKSQDAWEVLTRSLIEAGWTITAAFPVASEGANSLHQKDTASTASSIFLSCRKRTADQPFPTVWKGLDGQGVQHRIRAAVQQGLGEFKPLNLTPVDEMVACYGRALHVLSERWPVMDGDEPVSPLRAMSEASRVVAEHQIDRITDSRLTVDDLDPETAMALTLYGIWGLGEFAYDEALNLCRSLHISLSARPTGYRVEGRMIGTNQETEGHRGRSRGAETADLGYHAPLVRKGSKLRLARPEERNARRLAQPQTDWDVLHGVIQAYRRGDVPVARAYLKRHAPQHSRRILDLLDLWAAEMDDAELRREAEIIHFGLRPVAG
jgi:adenine-specific DNA methylase